MAAVRFAPERGRVTGGTCFLLLLPLLQKTGEHLGWGLGQTFAGVPWDGHRLQVISALSQRDLLFQFCTHLLCFVWLSRVAPNLSVSVMQLGYRNLFSREVGIVPLKGPLAPSLGLSASSNLPCPRLADRACCVLISALCSCSEAFPSCPPCECCLCSPCGSLPSPSLRTSFSEFKLMLPLWPPLPWSHLLSISLPNSFGTLHRFSVTSLSTSVVISLKMRILNHLLKCNIHVGKYTYHQSTAQLFFYKLNTPCSQLPEAELTSPALEAPPSPGTASLISRHRWICSLCAPRAVLVLSSASGAGSVCGQDVHTRGLVSIPWGVLVPVTSWWSWVCTSWGSWGVPGRVGRVDTDRACNSSPEQVFSAICAHEASSPMSCFYQPISLVFVAPSVR